MKSMTYQIVMPSTYSIIDVTCLSCTHLESHRSPMHSVTMGTLCSRVSCAHGAPMLMDILYSWDTLFSWGLQCLRAPCFHGYSVFMGHLLLMGTSEHYMQVRREVTEHIHIAHSSSFMSISLTKQTHLHILICSLTVFTVLTCFASYTSAP